MPSKTKFSVIIFLLGLAYLFFQKSREVFYHLLGQLWHGLPLKKLAGLSSLPPVKEASMNQYPSAHKGNHSLPSQSLAREQDIQDQETLYIRLNNKQYAGLKWRDIHAVITTKSQHNTTDLIQRFSNTLLIERELKALPQGFPPFLSVVIPLSSAQAYLTFQARTTSRAEVALGLGTVIYTPRTFLTIPLPPETGPKI